MATIVEQIGVLLIGDDIYARKGLRAVIEADSALTLVGEAADCTEALALAGVADASVIVVNSRPSGQACLRLMEELDRRGLDVAVLVLGGPERGSDGLRLVQAGVAACLDATVSPDELVGAVRTVACGGHVLDPQVLSVVLRDYGVRSGRTLATGAHTLTPRERQVLTLIAEGRSTREIAAELSLSPRTVEVHRRHIMEKLDLHRVADLVRYAVREGLVSLGEP